MPRSIDQLDVGDAVQLNSGLFRTFEYPQVRRRALKAESSVLHLEPRASCDTITRMNTALALLDDAHVLQREDDGQITDPEHTKTRLEVMRP